MKTLNNDIKTHQFHQLYLLYGEEDFLRRSYKNRLKAAILSDDGAEMNFLYQDNRSLDFTAFTDFADTLPFLSEYRLIIIENSGLFAKSCEEWCEYLSRLPESTLVIFVEEKVDRRNKLYKLVSQKGYAASLERPEPEQLRRWVIQYVGEKGLQFQGDALSYFMESCTDGMFQISNELEKLSSYCAGKDLISLKDVQDICSVQLSAKVFALMDAITEGNTKTTFRLYEDMLGLKEPPLRILFLLTRQIGQLLTVKELRKNHSQSETASLLGLRPFVVDKLEKQARSFSQTELSAYVKELLSLEERVKTGRLVEQTALEMGLMTILNRLKKE